MLILIISPFCIFSVDGGAVVRFKCDLGLSD